MFPRTEVAQMITRMVISMIDPVADVMNKTAFPNNKMATFSWCIKKMGSFVHSFRPSNPFQLLHHTCQYSWLTSQQLRSSSNYMCESAVYISTNGCFTDILTYDLSHTYLSLHNYEFRLNKLPFAHNCQWAKLNSRIIDSA